MAARPPVEEPSNRWLWMVSRLRPWHEQRRTHHAHIGIANPGRLIDRANR
jgi:hypothetical protein